MRVTERLRQEIERSGLTCYRIGTDSGVDIRTVERIVKRQVAPNGPTIDALSEYFDLELAPKKQLTPSKQAKKKQATTGKQATKKR